MSTFPPRDQFSFDYIHRCIGINMMMVKNDHEQQMNRFTMFVPDCDTWVLKNLEDLPIKLKKWHPDLFEGGKKISQIRLLNTWKNLRTRRVFHEDEYLELSLRRSSYFPGLVIFNFDINEQ